MTLHDLLASLLLDLKNTLLLVDASVRRFLGPEHHIISYFRNLVLYGDALILPGYNKTLKPLLILNVQRRLTGLNVET